MGDGISAQEIRDEPLGGATGRRRFCVILFNSVVLNADEILAASLGVCANEFFDPRFAALRWQHRLRLARRLHL